MPRPFTVEALCAEVARLRGRALHLHPLPFAAAPGVPCGLWVATRDADHVFHARGASALHQRNTILHEIGHVLCDHGLEGGPAGLLTDLDPEVVRRVLGRTTYSTPQEEEAEMVAALLLERAGWSTADDRPPGVLGHLSDVFVHGNR
ncbi:ImmA/IrrE family metallo-endopeptidase [Saccharothrix sp. Mg75]|uniref:ImmA/IrrE family metallo-endopeptidase n=1 Tax=Saccharothrix sp. Mg75 TaxID=3445357 RepID=UPI003EF004D2